MTQDQDSVWPPYILMKYFLILPVSVQKFKVKQKHQPGQGSAAEFTKLEVTAKEELPLAAIIQLPSMLL